MNPVRTRGFTLIELLVVISIVSLLSSVILTTLSEARGKARDAQRKVQVDQFVKALQIYYTTYGTYPCADSACGTAVFHFTEASNAGQALIAAGAISEIPSDPSKSDIVSCNSGGAGFCYCSNGGTAYFLSVDTEDDKGSAMPRCYVQMGDVGSPSLCGTHRLSYAADSCTSRF